MLDCNNYNYEDLLEKLFTDKENNYSYLWIALKCLLDKNIKPLDDSSVNEYEELIKDFSNPYLRALFNYVLLREKSIKEILVRH